MVDILTVLAHLLSIVVLCLPLVGFVLLQRTQQAPFSLIPQSKLITREDLLQDYWLLPVKLYYETGWIKPILAAIAIFCTFFLIDLLYYYLNMQFPQEKFFESTKPQDTNFLQKYFRRFMWFLVLCSIFILLSYIGLCSIWLLLGAIINPTAFLPYATAASTFITVISSKYAQFVDIAENGLKKVNDAIKNAAESQIANMMKSMDLQGKVKSVMDSSAFQAVAGDAAKLGLVDEKTLQAIQNNADAMLKDPLKAAEQAGDK